MHLYANAIFKRSSTNKQKSAKIAQTNGHDKIFKKEFLIRRRSFGTGTWKNPDDVVHTVAGSALPSAAAAALFLAKYSSARARFFATDGFTHFFRPGNTVRVQPAA